MTSFLRSLKTVNRLNNSSKSIILNKCIENSSADSLLHLQPLFLSNDFREHTALVQTKLEKQNEQEKNFAQRISKFNKEIFNHGIITKFNIDDLLEDIKKSGTTNLQGLFLLRCCSELISDKSPLLRKQLGEEIWNILSETGVKLDVSHYNALLDIYLESEFDFSPADFLNKMSKANVKPNRVTFQKLIFQYCNRGKVESAMELIKVIGNEEIELNENIYSSLIHGHLKNGNSEQAYKVLDSMKSNDILITSKTQSVFMYHYATTGEIDKVKQILEECKTKEIWIPEKIILNIVYNFIMNGFTEFSEEILSLSPKGITYTKEANKIIYKLIERQKEDDAFKIFQTLPKNNFDPLKTGNFFLETLINFNVPTEKIIEFYKYMKQDGIINPQTIALALQSSFTHEVYESSMTLMKTWQDIEGTVREHYFYRILKAYGEAGQTEDVLKVIETMISQFKLNPSVFTIKNFVLPYMKGEAEELFFKLVYRLVNIENAANAIILKFLSENKFRKVIRFVSINNNLPLKMRNIQSSLIQTYKNTQDTPAFVWIVHYLHRKLLDMKLEESSSKSFPVIDSCILEAIKCLPADDTYLKLTLLRSLADKGISISQETAQEIESIVGSEMKSEFLDVINSLKSGTLTSKLVSKEHFSRYFLENLMEIGKLEITAKKLSDMKDNSAKYIKKMLLYHHCRTLNEDKARAVVEDLEEIDVSVIIRMINMYVYLKKIDEVEYWLNKGRELSNFKLPPDLILRWAALLVKNNRIEEAENSLSWKPVHDLTTYHSPKNRDLHNLLSAVSKLDDEKLLDKFYGYLETYGYINTENWTKPHVYKYYIVSRLSRGDNESAVRKFELLYERYKLPPCSYDLMKKFVDIGDDKLLERVKNICFQAFGEINTYIDLAIINLENGDLEEAEKIFKNHCPSLFERKIFFYADAFYFKKEINKLERLFYVLNNLHYDVEKLCVLLLKCYSYKNKWNEGYDLWMRMQNSDMVPSNNFIDCFNLIINNDHTDQIRSVDNFYMAIENFNIEKSKNLLESIPILFKNDCYSKLCQMLIRVYLITESVDYWKDLKVRYNLDLRTSIAEEILTKILEKRDISNMQKIDSFLDPNVKKELFFSSYLNDVYLQTGAWNLFLKNLESKLDDGTLNNKNLQVFMNNRIIMLSLIKHPEIVERYEKLAMKFFTKDIFEPLVLTWIYHFLNKNKKADELWEKYIKYRHVIPCEQFFHFSRDKNDPELYIKLASLLTQSLSIRKAKLKIYTILIKDCMKLDHPQKYEYSLKCLQYGLTDLTMEEFDLNLLVKLQRGLEDYGIQWPWSTKPIEL